MDSGSVTVQVAVGSARTSRLPTQLQGVSAQLAQASAQLRKVAPAGQWDEVFDEVRRVQAERSTSLLAAMQVVYAKLCTGWTPGTGRTVPGFRTSA